jgi:hypothetical protein
LSFALQTSHAPQLDVAQHTPSTTNPDAQSLGASTTVPFLALHSPRFEQILPSAAPHVSASSMFSTAVQRPGLVPLHVRQVLQDKTLQQTPSTQNDPFKQSSFVVQPPPSVR